jgi:diketogulonate reductase-like aldo/keto reductase
MAGQLHAFSQKIEVVDYCKKSGIVVEAYCSLVRNMKAKNVTLNEIARKHGKQTGHILLRYCLQKGWVPLRQCKK